ncbi:MAG: hypothetical protein K6C35_01200 [Eubacterium sp.]|nr:hypothetical protein [Eubacterium sp.]
MPEINRIRVNNVKYNFGTQYYDDFTMRMYGKNTIYDLANGGGKSVLMLLLMQNLIPNCTLDDKQPVEKLFRDGCGNTTIHSLVEWKLDKTEDSEGYRYMTTGFCARKAKDSSAENIEEASDGGVAAAVASEGSSTATIEYFNYCIFYNSYNKNDIINLPLTKDKEHISYQALKNYLLDLSHKNIELKVIVFDKKGEYQRFISSYGLHESQWEIIRGINKTEGHVRTYFETNYKTTRKVVEDLLIEEIIDKAFLVRTEKDEGSKNGMARLLMNIREQLKNLAEKKRDIASYDHQTELIELLSDRVRSFEALYRDKDEVEQKLADIYETVKKENQEKQKEKDNLLAELSSAENEKYELTRKLEELKVSRDMLLLDKKKEEIQNSEERLTELRERLAEDERSLMLAETGNEYLEYIKDSEQKRAVDEKRRLLAENDESGMDVHAICYNIKRLIDGKLASLDMDEEEVSGKEEKEREEYDTAVKRLQEAETGIAVSWKLEKASEESVQQFNERLSAFYSELNDKSFDELKVKLLKANLKEKEIAERIKENAKRTEELLKKTDLDRARLGENISETAAVKLEREKTEKIRNSFNSYKGRLDSLASIYISGDEKNLGRLEEEIEEKLKDASLRLRDKEKILRDLTKRYNDILEGILIEKTDGVEKVLTYLRTRHGIFAMSGMDYLAALPEDKKKEVLQKVPQLPYGIVSGDFEKIKNDQNIGDVDTGNELVTVFDEKLLDEDAAAHFGCSIDKAVILHRNAEFFTDEASVERLAAVKKAEIDTVKEEIQSLRDMKRVAGEDLEFVRTATADDAISAKERADLLLSEENKLILQKTEIESEISKSENELLELRNAREAYENSRNDNSKDIILLERAIELEELSGEEKQKIEKIREDRARLIKEKEQAEREAGRLNSMLLSLRDRMQLYRSEKAKLTELWNSKYKAYYLEDDYDILDMDITMLGAAFDVAVNKSKDKLMEQDSLRILSETLAAGMSRTLKNIENRKSGLTEFLEKEMQAGRLSLCEQATIESLRENVRKGMDNCKDAETKLSEVKREHDKLSGSIDYAVKNINDAFGSFNRVSETADVLENMYVSQSTRLAENKELIASKKKEIEQFEKKSRTAEDIFKDVSRIIERNEIDTSKAKLLPSDGDMMKGFEDHLVRYDNLQKNMEKAKLELVRTKGRIAETLTEMGVAGLSATIREDVNIPVNLTEAEALVQSLRETGEVIRIEKERIGKSLSDMELLHDSFVDQCLDRCLDVRTELEMLSGLSGIVLGDEKIEMIKLSIPYVKDEFMRDRMSSYIDRTVDEADKINDDEARLRFLRTSLTTKKLFGVIVTDMNKIKLSLYKRERIKEQSRYLKYEEAVGSTGQSQGIYIQFLVSIINYISGMYSPENIGTRTKTIFIDNPFGAAKDIYIWEPIFALLKANNVQLIVPARGASPAITGRFDVNYVLGQQRQGNREVTVVVNYESSTSQEELEYHELSYEQQTFDFI